MSFLKKNLDNFKNNSLSEENLIKKIEKLYGYSQFSTTKIDDYREERTGIPEFIFGLSKTKQNLASILRYYIKNNKNCLITKVNSEKINFLKSKFPQIHFNKRASLVWYRYKLSPHKKHSIGVITAGTSDIPIAMESFITLAFLGYSPTLITDVGVSAIQRILSKKEKLKQLKVIICIAGMEATLPTVIAGLSGKPIIGVPTSTGYGVSKDGITALNSMLSSCSPNVSTVNIDNGFGASCYAHSILNLLNE